MSRVSGDLEVVYDPLPGDALTRFISDGVVNINIARTGAAAWHPANFFLKNSRASAWAACSAISGAAGCT